MVPGTQLDRRYEILRHLGSGAFATVYLARHTGLLSLHAIKMLDERIAQDADLRNRFLAEGRIQAQLRHPNIVAVTDIVTDPAPGLVMEYVEGPTLDEFVAERGGPPPIELVLDLMLPLLDGVGAAHKQGIVHRDLKPENIIVSRDGSGKLRPMVVDFGIAKVMGGASLATGKRKTAAGTRMGTLLYMSPEQVRGAADLDARSDIFALGAILYEVVTSRVAFEATSEFDTLSNIVKGHFEPPERLIGGLPPMFAACIRKALAVEPSERFQTCEMFRQALALALDSEAPLPERPSRSVAITRAPELLASPTATTPRSPTPARALPPALPDLPRVPEPGASAKPGAIAPNPDTSPFGAALLSLCCLPGLGQIYNGQVGKGLLALVSTAMLSALTDGGSLCVIGPILCVDAYCVAAKRRKGRTVGSWEWF